MADVRMRVEGMRRRLKEAGHRITPQRLAILGVLANSEEHPGAADIYERVKVHFPTTSMATVYKTISVLKELGEILELEFSNDFNRYDGNRPLPHPHLICVECGKIVDPVLDVLDDVTRKLKMQTGFTIISHRLDFYGFCPECRKKI